jgi:hypothetical protein
MSNIKGMANITKKQRTRKNNHVSLVSVADNTSSSVQTIIPKKCTIIDKIFSKQQLFRYINEYVSFMFLCDTCSYLSNLKKYIIYKLNRNYSLKYYNDVLFRNLVKSKIDRTSKQLYLNVCCSVIITDVSFLDDVFSINLSNCKNISDVSKLGKVYILDLSCTNVTDVNALDDVYNLNLQGCKNIRDVSNLGNVHILDLSNHDNINVSNLGNINTLYLNSCKNIIGINKLTNVRTLNLCGADINSVIGLENVCTLNLSGCNNITDFSPLYKVHTLDLSFIRKVDVSALENVYNLNLSYCKNIIGLNNLKNVRILNLSFCNNVTNISGLTGVYNLSLRCCENIKDFSSLPSLHTLDLAYNSHFDVSALEKFPCLTSLNLMYCKNVKGIYKLWNVRSINLSGISI